MTFAEEMIALSETQAAIERERMRWAAEKAVSRLDTAADMLWVLRQAGDDYTLAEKYLEIWDRGTELGVNPIYLISEIARQRRLSGEARVTARFSSFVTTAPIEFSPTSKVWFATSHKPQVRNDDSGIWRRLITAYSVRPIRIPVCCRAGNLALRLAMYIALEWVL